MDLFHSHEWVLSIVQAVSSLQVTRRIFRKTWSSSTVLDSPGAMFFLFLHEWVHYTENKELLQISGQGFHVTLIGSATSAPYMNICDFS